MTTKIEGYEFSEIYDSTNPKNNKANLTLYRSSDPDFDQDSDKQIFTDILTHQSIEKPLEERLTNDLLLAPMIVKPTSQLFSNSSPYSSSLSSSSFLSSPYRSTPKKRTKSVKKISRKYRKGNKLSRKYKSSKKH